MGFRSGAFGSLAVGRGVRQARGGGGEDTPYREPSPGGLSQCTTTTPPPPSPWALPSLSSCQNACTSCFRVKKQDWTHNNSFHRALRGQVGSIVLALNGHKPTSLSALLTYTCNITCNLWCSDKKRAIPNKYVTVCILFVFYLLGTFDFCIIACFAKVFSLCFIFSKWLQEALCIFMITQSITFPTHVIGSGNSPFHQWDCAWCCVAPEWTAHANLEHPINKPYIEYVCF